MLSTIPVPRKPFSFLSLHLRRTERMGILAGGRSCGISGHSIACKPFRRTTMERCRETSHLRRALFTSKCPRLDPTRSRCAYKQEQQVAKRNRKIHKLRCFCRGAERRLDFDFDGMTSFDSTDPTFGVARNQRHLSFAPTRSNYVNKRMCWA